MRGSVGEGLNKLEKVEERSVRKDEGMCVSGKEIIMSSGKFRGL